MNAHTPPKSPWSDYPDAAWDNDIPPEEDHDEPYDRCPLCNAVIAAIVAAGVLGVLMLAAFAIKAAVGVLV